jgi:predicted AAA+ superfamily ATPase
MRVGRYLAEPVRQALHRKMVFIGGPRQVGKTRLALTLLGDDADETHPAYLNWDHPGVPPRLRSAQLPAGEPLIRDTDGREVDFVVLRNRKPMFAVECKSGEKAVSPALRYVAERTPIPRFFQVHRGTGSFVTGRITVLPFIRWCEELGLP